MAEKFRTVENLLSFFSGSQIISVIDYSAMIPRPIVLRTQKAFIKQDIGALNVLFSETANSVIFNEFGEDEIISQLYIYTSSEEVNLELFESD